MTTNDDGDDCHDYSGVIIDAYSRCSNSHSSSSTCRVIKDYGGDVLDDDACVNYYSDRDVITDACSGCSSTHSGSSACSVDGD